ncbi:MAG: hypothetical protein E7071_03930 [Bacteroidales bacterium]|nr:hypothetical protein [Bacteroidales bacterium]
MKQIVKRMLLLAGVACGSVGVYGQQMYDIEELLKSSALPYYENLYVHTDRNNYQPGDTLFLRGDLFSAVLNRQMLNSRFIYVDLVDDSDAVLHREKVALDTINGSFNGYFPLNGELESGVYTLRAYTYFMQNLGKDYLFEKKIGIGNTPVLGELVLTENSDFKLESSSGSTSVKVELSVPADSEIKSSNVSVSVVAVPSVVGETSPNENGYKPFDINGLVARVSSIKEPEYSIELSTVLSGYVETLKGERLPNTKLKIYGDNGTFYFAETDANGHVVCPIEWGYGSRFYVRAYNLERKYVYADELDVLLKADNTKFLDVVCADTPYSLFTSAADNKTGWTDNKIRYVEEGRMGVQHGPFVALLPNEGDVTAAVMQANGSMGKSGSLNTYGEADDDVIKKNIKSKKKHNIQRVVNGVQRQDVEFAYSGGATRYWNPNAVVKGGESFEFLFPASADIDSYVVVVNGVDDKGNPVSGVYKVEGER